jgi:hypothetical protein
MRPYSEAFKADVRGRMSSPYRQSVARISEELDTAVLNASHGGDGRLAGAANKVGRPSGWRTLMADQRRASAEGDRADRRGECRWRRPGERLP